MAASGHNSVNASELTRMVEKIEKLNRDRAVISEDVAETYAIAKGLGFDIAVIRKLVALRKAIDKDPDAYREMNEMIRLYAEAVGQDDPFA